MIFWVSEVLNRNVVDSNWRFDNLCCIQSQADLYLVS